MPYTIKIEKKTTNEKVFIKLEEKSDHIIS